MQKYILKIKPLTPIWTGDANKKNTIMRETGIIGSLRWWYEALIRGLGGTACDPTSDEKSSGKCPDVKGNYCDVCELFGCTSCARKFKLEV
ncbi:MAG: type III-B CRISPR module RAMP protein Cmr1, partial [Candidatus Helarchaeota archaeon]